MRLIKTIRLLLNFYWSFFLASIIITGGCVSVFGRYGWETFNSLVWFKLSTFAIIYMLLAGNKRKEYYYYHNLGLGKTILWTAAFTLDFLIFILALIITYRMT